jgi:CRP-like cAMP-binding protein
MPAIKQCPWGAHDQENQLTTAILRPGQLLATAAVAGVRHQAAFAEELEPQTCVCDATAEEFLRMMSAHPLLAAKVMVALARQALRLEHLAFQEVPVRLAQTLRQLADDNGGRASIEPKPTRR